MHYSKKVETTHYLTFDEEDGAMVQQVLQLARNQIGMLPDGSHRGVAEWMNELESNLRTQSYHYGGEDI
jgi:hypothetical protein